MARLVAPLNAVPRLELDVPANERVPLVSVADVLPAKLMPMPLVEPPVSVTVPVELKLALLAKLIPFEVLLVPDTLSEPEPDADKVFEPPRLTPKPAL